MATSSFNRKFVVRAETAIEVLKLVLAEKAVVTIAKAYSFKESKRAAKLLAERLRDSNEK